MLSCGPAAKSRAGCWTEHNLLFLKPPYLGLLPRDGEGNSGQALSLQGGISCFLKPMRNLQEDGHVHPEQASPVWYLADTPNNTKLDPLKEWSCGARMG